MIDAPRIARTEELQAAVVHLQIPRDMLEAEMPAAIEEVRRALADQGVEPCGPMFAHHLTTSAERFDFEVGYPVSAPVAPRGRVKPGILPGVQVVRSVYRGPYEGLFAAWDEFGKRAEVELAKHGLRPGSTLWETYLAGPETDPDPSAWRTELNVPLREPAP